MKSSGGRDTFLLFLFILVVVSTACYLLVIKPNCDILSDVNLELEQVEQTKAKNDTKPFSDILVQLTKEIEEALE